MPSEDFLYRIVAVALALSSWVKAARTLIQRNVTLRSSAPVVTAVSARAGAGASRPSATAAASRRRRISRRPRHWPR